MSEDAGVTEWPPPNAPGTDLPYFVSADELARGFRPVIAEPPEQRWRRRGLAFLGPALLLPLLGAPVALLWRAVTPVVGIARTASGPQPTAGESDQFFAIEGWFVVVTVVVGLALGAVAWRLLRGQGPAGAIGVAVGGLCASAVTALVGSRLVVDSYMHGFCGRPDLDCPVYDGTMTLRAPGAIVAWPVAMLVAFAALTLIAERD